MVRGGAGYLPGLFCLPFPSRGLGIPVLHPLLDFDESGLLVARACGEIPGGVWNLFA